MSRFTEYDLQYVVPTKPRGWDDEVSALVVHTLDYLIRHYHIPMVGPIDEASCPACENRAEGSSQRELDPVYHIDQPWGEQGGSASLTEGSGGCGLGCVGI